jgi:Na+-driven multidrug efflux pump
VVSTFYEKLDNDARGVVDFEKLRFELAWRHFEFHARQRTTMFHFFIILAPFLFGGCFILFKEREIVGAAPAIVAAGAGALLAVIFYLLDQRNKQLYSVSKEALSLLEQHFLYTADRPLKVSGADYQGVMSTEAQRYGQNNLLKHSLLMGVVFWLAFALFASLALYFLAVRQGCIKLATPSSITASQKSEVRQ